MKINKAIKILITSEVVVGSALCIVSPVFSIFILKSIEGGTIQLAGTALAITMVVKSVTRIPLGYYLDKIKGDFDDYYSLVTGFILFSLSQFLYIFAKLPVHIYILQIISGLAVAFFYTPWYGFFSKKIDKKHETYEWSVGASLSGFAAALASYLGGYIAQRHGFSILFVLSGIILSIGTILIILSKKSLARE